MIWRLAAANLLAITTGMLSGLAPLALKYIVDTTANGSTQRHLSTPALAGAAYLGCICLGRMLAEVRPLLASTAEQKLFTGLRVRFFAHALGLPLDDHRRRPCGAMLNDLQQAISGYQIILFSLGNSVLPVLVEGVTVTLVLLSLSQPALNAAFAATAAAYLAVMAWRTRGLGAAASDVVSASASTNSLITDGLLNIEPIKCFGVERSSVSALEQAAVVLQRSWARLHRQRMHTGLAVTTVFTAAMAGSLTLAGQARTDGEMTVGGLVLVSLYMAQILRPLEMLATACRDLSQGLRFVTPLQAVFDQPSEIQMLDKETTPSTAPRAKSPGIRFRNVTLRFSGGEPVLDAMSLDIPGGRATAIVGASGCGKSSLVRVLLRLCDVQAGEVLLDDLPTTRLSPPQLRSMIAVVPQDTVLFNTSIAANIAIGKEGATPSEIMSAARRARLHDAVSALPLGYDTLVGERGLKLSGGERQRIAIARAILRDPLIYILDEATSMLDGPTEASIIENLREVSSGRTVIVIAHRLAAVQHLEDIVVIARGRVAERGGHAGLLERGGIYAAMWRAQARPCSPDCNLSQAQAAKHFR
ncbi:MAG: ABC transporter ATP-binding protein [Paucibacter sp.]|nr:ABC transporter ATP-binding protein [Roseateles sp.]